MELKVLVDRSSDGGYTVKEELLMFGSDVPANRAYTMLSDVD